MGIAVPGRQVPGVGCQRLVVRGGSWLLAIGDWLSTRICSSPIASQCAMPVLALLANRQLPIVASGASLQLARRAAAT